MTNDEKLEILETMQNGGQVAVTSKVMLAYLKLAESVVLNRLYPFDEDKHIVPSKYELQQIAIANYLINKQGAEGETQHSENGISRTYESADVPESMLKGIVPFAKPI